MRGIVGYIGNKFEEIGSYFIETERYKNKSHM